MIGEKINKNKIIQRFSSRYCYKVYPSAIVVWIVKVINNPIPLDILKYLLGAVRYFEHKEWRISIVLSAIAVETILAEIFEEIKHEPALGDTLGTIFNKIRKIIKIPQEIEEDIKKVNNARILSVHRSSTSIEDSEACNSLIGATRFMNWVYFEGPFKY